MSEQLNHGNRRALDFGALHALGLGVNEDHDHVLRGHDPAPALLLVPGTEPMLDTRFADLTPRTPNAALPHVCFCRILAANGCEQVEETDD